jgi:hypothetical protein
MVNFRKLLVICALAQPLAVFAQDRALPDPPRAAPSAAAPGDQPPAAPHEPMRAMRERMGRAGDTQSAEQRESAMHEHMQGMQQRMSTLEGRLDSIERSLRELLELQRAQGAQGTESRRERRR